ncbi:MAG: transketolase [Oscillospiraceae bacterium]|nr:transketolase [Oscillospiraceae bacterium]
MANREEKIAYLQGKARDLRLCALEMIYEAQSGHPGGAFSAADIIAALYYDELHLNPQDARDPDRDRFILSKGHVCPVLYAALGDLGFFDRAYLHTLRKEGSILQGHPSMSKCPGIDISTGSLGQGLSCAVGMALAGKRDKKAYRVFAMVGDGECNEGQIWEALMTAYKYRLSNLVVIFDGNGLQIQGPCDEVMPMIDIVAKAKAFGCETFEIDGHDMGQILDVLDAVRNSESDLPKFIKANTIKGKGVDYMENSLDWHGAAPNKEQYEDAVAQLKGEK